MKIERTTLAVTLCLALSGPLAAGTADVQPGAPTNMASRHKVPISASSAASHAVFAPPDAGSVLEAREEIDQGRCDEAGRPQCVFGGRQSRIPAVSGAGPLLSSRSSRERRRR